MWGFTAFAYFPIEGRFILFGFFLALLVGKRFRQWLYSLADTLLCHLFASGSASNIFFVIVVAAAGFAYYSFPMKTDIFGDTKAWEKYLADNAHPIWNWFKEIWSINFFESKEAFTVNFHRFVASLFSLSIGDAFCIVDVVCGVIFIGLWMLFLRKYFQASKFQSILFLTALLLGVNQIFFGHIETYTFASIFAFVFLWSMFLFLDGKAPLWIVLVLFVLASKAHIIYVLFFPGLLIAIAWRMKDRYPWLNKHLTWKYLSIYFLAPIILFGIILYFFYFHSYDVLRTYDHRSMQRVFLPLISSPPPYDRYSLLSFSHLFDIFNVFVMIGAPALLLAFGIIFLSWKEISWNSPRIVVYGVFCIFIFLFFFAVDPQLSMERDWDIICLFGAPLLFFIAAVMLHWKQKKLPIMELFIITLIGGLASLGFYTVNASSEMVSHRVEDLGEYAYRTYYTESCNLISAGELMEKEPMRQLKRRIEMIDELAPYVVGEDKEYARLLTRIAVVYLTMHDDTDAVTWMDYAYNLAPHDVDVYQSYELFCQTRGDSYLLKKKSEKALYWYKKAYDMDSSNVYVLKMISQLLLWQDNYAKSLEYALMAIHQDTNDLPSLELAGNALLHLRKNEEAVSYFKRAEKIAPNDPKIRGWLKQVQSLSSK